MSENRPIDRPIDGRVRRPFAALASLAVVAVMVLVPAALPLCAMEMDACAADAMTVPQGVHCPMESGGLPEMPCCVQDTSPQGPAPAAPAKQDADLRVQLKAPALAPALAQTFDAALSADAPAPAPPAAPAASAVPLYTLLSTLLN